jgi:hypothetical protein
MSTLLLGTPAIVICFGKAGFPIMFPDRSFQFNSIQFNSIQFNSIQFNSIQFNTMIAQSCCVPRRLSNRLHFRLRKDQCRTTRGVKTFPERVLPRGELERVRGDARLGFRDGDQEILQDALRAICVWWIFFRSAHPGVDSVHIAFVFP